MADNSQVLLNCTFATVLRPADLASAQCRTARGPGPTDEMEYSPTFDGTPPLSIGLAHSLTDISQTDSGNLEITSGASPCPCQPQSQTITLASGLARCT